MTPAKFDLYFATFPYGGTGGTAQEVPAVRMWYTDTILKAKADPRVGVIHHRQFSDTPITMTRNAAVYEAQQAGADLLVMIDSDMHPDLLVGQDPTAKPFWDVAFNLFCERYPKLTVLGAPYGGPPPVENCYVFRWANWQSDHPDPDMRIEGYTREEAAGRSGIEAVAALPTGLILFDLRAFDLVSPPHFYYEFTDKYERQKASTEDVTATRDISFACQERYGYNCLFTSWDSWAGHYKPKCVGKPKSIYLEQINSKYKQAVLNGQKRRERLVFLGEGRNGQPAKPSVPNAG